MLLIREVTNGVEAGQTCCSRMTKGRNWLDEEMTFQGLKGGLLLPSMRSSCKCLVKKAQSRPVSAAPGKLGSRKDNYFNGQQLLARLMWKRISSQVSCFGIRRTSSSISSTAILLVENDLGTLP